MNFKAFLGTLNFSETLEEKFFSVQPVYRNKRNLLNYFLVYEKKIKLKLYHCGSGSSKYFLLSIYNHKCF